jgi:type II secretion system (T2SS) protein E
MHLMRHENGTAETPAGQVDGHDGEQTREEAHRARPPLAALLVEAGVATEEQLRLAASEGMATGERLGEVLLRRGSIDEPSLAGLLARQWDLPFDDGEGPADESALALLPASEAERLEACPVGFADGTPVVAIAEPTDDRMSAVHEALQRDARFVVVTRTRLLSLLGKPSPAPAEEDAVPETPVEPTAAEPSAVEGDAQTVLTDLDAATASLAAVREKAERLAAAQQDSLQELEHCGVELDALRAARAEDQATIESLQRQLADQRERTASVRSRLAELTDALTEA